MNLEEYKEYQEAFTEFMKEEGINNLSRISESIDPFFSYAPCDCCNRHLAGDRINADGWNPKEEEIQEYTICLDCEYYAEYGQLDDMTMLDIEKSD